VCRPDRGRRQGVLRRRGLPKTPAAPSRRILPSRLSTTLDLFGCRRNGTKHGDLAAGRPGLSLQGGAEWPVVQTPTWR